jgi:hypothetical protein
MIESIIHSFESQFHFKIVDHYQIFSIPFVDEFCDNFGMLYKKQFTCVAPLRSIHVLAYNRLLQSIVYGKRPRVNTAVKYSTITDHMSKNNTEERCHKSRHKSDVDQSHQTSWRIHI